MRHTGRWQREIWRHEPDSNRRASFCRALPDHSAIAPDQQAAFLTLFPVEIQSIFLYTRKKFLVQDVSEMPLALSSHQNFEKAREAMVLSQLAPSGVVDERVLTAYRCVPREVFVPHTVCGVAYGDAPVPVGGGRVLLDPLVHGLMLEAASVKTGDKVLDIGGATGYSAAVLSYLARSIVALEQETEFLKTAQNNWASLGLCSIAAVLGPHVFGVAGQGPFDVIVVNGAVASIPDPLLDQLAFGGRLVCVLLSPGDLVGRVACFTKLSSGQLVHAVVADALNTEYLAGFAPPATFIF